MSPLLSSILLTLLVGQSSCFYDPHCNGKTVIVHLFEWKWSSIAAECERFLADAGYCGVQVRVTLQTMIATVSSAGLPAQ